MTPFKVNIYSILIKVAYCAILMICNSNQIKSLLLYITTAHVPWWVNSWERAPDSAETIYI